MTEAIQVVLEILGCFTAAGLLVYSAEHLAARWDHDNTPQRREWTISDRRGS